MTTVGTALLKALGTPSANPIVLEANETTIGRDPSCQIVLETEGGVSRRHAAIYHRGQYFAIADLGSSNGTFVNGQRIQTEQPLRSGDRIQLSSQGPQFEFIQPPADKATIPVAPANNAVPTIIRPPIPQANPQPVNLSQPSQSSNTQKWVLIAAGLGAIVLISVSGLGAVIRSILSGLNNPSTSTQQPISTNPSQAPNPRPPQPPTDSQPPQTSNPQPSQTATGLPKVESSFICETSSGERCTEEEKFTNNSSIQLTIYYSSDLDSSTRFHSSARYTSPQGAQRQFDLGSRTFNRRIRSITLPLGKPSGGWLPGTYEITIEARNAAGSVTRTDTLTFR